LSQIHDDEKSIIGNESDSTFLPDSGLRSTEELPSDPHTIVPSAYSKILVPHDNTEMSDKALGHAIYIANATGAEINILFVIENINEISKSSLVASIENEETKLENSNGTENSADEKLKNGTDDLKNVTVTAHGQAKKIIDEKLNLCKNAGAKGRISFRIATGRSVDEEIINLANSGDADLIVMTSSTIAASLRSIGSTARKVIDNVSIPVLIIHNKDGNQK
jgi:nucleotide-binding universal stress UspA family protein